MQSFLSGSLDIINSQIHLESLKMLLKSGQWLNDEVQSINYTLYSINHFWQIMIINTFMKVRCGGSEVRYFKYKLYMYFTFLCIRRVLLVLIFTPNV